MKSWQKNVVVGVALVAFGAARMPFEAGVAQELRDAGLSTTRMEIDTREKIGQTSSAVALGGLRTLVATFLNLRAFSFFQTQRWDNLAETYDTIVDLAPRTRYYWETGAWHSAYNAASFYISDTKLPALRRKEAWRNSIIRGRTFLERGLRNNPGDWSMLANLGFLLSDSNKFQAFPDPDETFAAAADAYGRAADTGDALPYVRRAQLFALARVKGKEKESLALTRSLYQDQKNRVPTLLMLLLVFEAYENPELDTTMRAIDIFGTPEKAYDALSNHWIRIRDRFPVYGVAPALENLEKQLEIPEEKSVFNQRPAPLSGPDRWFEK